MNIFRELGFHKYHANLYEQICYCYLRSTHPHVYTCQTTFEPVALVVPIRLCVLGKPTL